MTGISATMRNGTGTVTLAEPDFSAFKTGHRGRCLTAADPGYDDARIIWNLMAAVRPADSLVRRRLTGCQARGGWR